MENPNNFHFPPNQTQHNCGPINAGRNASTLPKTEVIMEGITEYQLKNNTSLTKPCYSIVPWQPIYGNLSMTQLMPKSVIDLLECAGKGVFIAIDPGNDLFNLPKKKLKWATLNLLNQYVSIDRCK